MSCKLIGCIFSVEQITSLGSTFLALEYQLQGYLSKELKQSWFDRLKTMQWAGKMGDAELVSKADALKQTERIAST